MRDERVQQADDLDSTVKKGGQMKKIMTRERVRNEAKRLGLAGKVDRILTFAEQVLQLQPVEETPVTVPFRLRLRGERKTVFRLGMDYRGSGQLTICFPFYSWQVPDDRVLEALRTELLAAQPRLDKGGAEQDIRLALSKSNTDEMIAAICTVYCEVRRYLRYKGE